MLEDRDIRLTKANEQIRNLNDEMDDYKSNIGILQKQLQEEKSNTKQNCFGRLFRR